MHIPLSRAEFLVSCKFLNRPRWSATHCQV
jgi:hypothetical protein